MTTPTVDAIARVLVDQDREIARLRAIVDRMRGQLDEIRDLHLPKPAITHEGVKFTSCRTCHKVHPCKTARAAAPGRVVVEEGDL